MPIMILIMRYLTQFQPVFSISMLIIAKKKTLCYVQPVNNRPYNGNARANGGRVGLLRYGDVQGVRQSSGNWQRESAFKWIRRTYVQPLQYSRLQCLRQAVYVVSFMFMVLS